MTLKATTNVQILTNGLVEEFPVLVSIKPTNDLYSSFILEAKLLKQPKLIVVVKKNNIKIVNSSSPSVLQLEGTLVLEVMTNEMFPVSFPTEVSSAMIEQDAQKMTIVFEGGISAQGSVDLIVTHKAFLARAKTIVELKQDYPSKTIELGQVQNKAALSIDLKEIEVGELKKKNMKMNLTLSSSANLQGTVLNDTKPATTKLYEGIFVELK